MGSDVGSLFFLSHTRQCACRCANSGSTVASRNVKGVKGALEVILDSFNSMVCPRHHQTYNIRSHTSCMFNRSVKLMGLTVRRIDQE